MGYSLGIAGLPNVGKSAIFNCLTEENKPISNYPFCTCAEVTKLKDVLNLKSFQKTKENGLTKIEAGITLLKKQM